MDEPDGADLEQEHSLLQSAGPEGQLIGAEGGRFESQAQTPRKSNASRRSVRQDFPLEEDMTRSCRDKHGRWINPWPTWRFPSVFTLLKFLVWDKNNSNVPESKEVLDDKLPVLVPYFARGGAPDGGARCSHGDGVPGRGLRVTWLGHATTLVELDGLNVLTDPIFSQRASPSQFGGPKRIDAVVISHSHFDHLDAGTVRELNARFGADLHWLVPLGLSDWLAEVGCGSVTELDWWERSCVPGHEDTAFVCTPAQHWSKRTPLDHNKALWGSWCVLGPHHRFFFAGDTGYCSSFAEIGRHFGPFDLAAIPIGAYLPRHVMVGQHVDPEQAVEIHVDVRAKHSLAIHWGTFALAHEHYLEPPQRLREALEQKALRPGSFFTLHHGESWSAGPVGGGACG